MAGNVLARTGRTKELTPMEKKPYVVLNTAAVWICVDCGAKNYAELAPLSTPKDKAEAEASGVSPQTDLAQIPDEVKCIQCSKTFQTGEEPEVEEPPGPLDFIEDLYDLIDVLGHSGRQKRKYAAKFIRENHQVFLDALAWVLQGGAHHTHNEHDHEVPPAED